MRLFALLLFTTCVSTTSPTDTPFWLNAGQTNENVQFVSVREDSRCPVTVQCAWQGNAAVIVRVGSQEVTLNTAGGTQFPRTATVGNLTIELLEVRPEPREQKPAPNEYQVKLLVRTTS
jgi:hypothetical protein